MNHLVRRSKNIFSYLYVCLFSLQKHLIIRRDMICYNQKEPLITMHVIVRRKDLLYSQPHGINITMQLLIRRKLCFVWKQYFVTKSKELIISSSRKKNLLMSAVSRYHFKVYCYKEMFLYWQKYPVTTTVFWKTLLWIKSSSMTTTYLIAGRNVWQDVAVTTK